jgi:peptidoglycan lytic transglycosylase
VNHLPLRHRKTRGWIAIVALAAALAAAPGAEADPSTSALRDRAATVMAQIDRLDALRADATLRGQSARTRLLAARVDLAGTKVQIADAELGLRSARDALAQLVVSSYKNGNPDATSYLLGSGSFRDLILRVDVMDRASRSAGDLIDRIRQAQAELEAERAHQADAVARADQAVADAHAARAEAGRLLAERRSTLAHLNARISGLIAREQQRRAHLAEQNGGGSAIGGGGGTGGGGGGGGGGSTSTFSGEATWYNMPGATTASGEIYDPEKLTCASPWLPFNTLVKVTLLSTGRSVVVRVNDRGPFGGGILDLSVRGAREIGLLAAGRGQVTAQVVGQASSPAASRLAFGF